MTRTAFFIWLVATLLWIVAIGAIAWQNWPHLPLDVSHTDPATKAAYDQAVSIHAGRYVMFALLPPMVFLALIRVMFKQ